jgi:hypothetical protein
MPKSLKKTNRIVLNDTFDFKQKAILLVLSSIPVLFLIGLINNSDKNTESKNVFLFILISIICILILFLLLLIIFSKKGFLFNNNSLYLSYTFLNKNIYSKIILLDDKTSFTFLKQNILQKNTYLSAGGADLSYKDISFNIVLLNKNHTQKKHLITINSIKNTEELKLFIENATNLKYEIYNPNF